MASHSIASNTIPLDWPVNGQLENSTVDDKEKLRPGYQRDSA